jgi:uncharacterized protein (DUF488 family)
MMYEMGSEMGRNVRHLYTIGYAGHTLESFIQTLQTKHISLVLDIRMTPISRKKGFSKTALSQAMEAAGIRYQHLRTLGSPKELRQHLYAEGNYAAFFNAFRAYLGSQKDSLHQAAKLVSTRPVCLMCVEQCPDECHRSVVAEAIVQELGKRVIIQHLPAPTYH